MQRLIPVIAIIFAFAVIMLYIRPTYSVAIHDTRQQIDSFDAALTAADRFQQKEAELTQARAQIPAESLARLNAFLPDGVDNVQLILDMDALAARSGITLSDFNIDDASSGSTDPTQAAPSAPGAPALSLMSSSAVDSINLTFKATGTYTSFRTFLAAIENSLRPLDIVDLSVDESATGVYTYNVTVRIYWLR
jgi:hypothetical protein